MRTALHRISLLSFILIIYSSCHKYPDGPSFSLRPKAWRLSGSWQVEQFFINGQDMTSSVYPNKEYFENYEVGGTYSYTVGTSSTSPSGEGKWSWVDKHTRILRSASPYAPDDATISIFRLENKSLWYKYTIGSNTYEYHMQQD